MDKGLVRLNKPAAGMNENSGENKSGLTVRIIMARSDVSRLREIYDAMSQEQRETHIQTLKGNTVFIVKPSHN